MKNQILFQSDNLREKLIQTRRWLHSHAGTAFDTAQTVEYVREQLISMGLNPVSCGKAGLTAVIEGSKPGKTILLRADMDALPIREESGLEFACKNGNMHACGHDFHTTMLLGAAQLLVNNRDKLCGTVKLMFQSAEEVFQGAADMIANGVLEDPKPDAAMMIHVTVGLPIPAGTVIVSAPGVSAPAADYFTIKVQGKGCHGSAPQNGIDALTAAAHILIALQELHARELAANSEAVLTIGKFNGGTAENVIADSAVLGGTIRTYDEQTRAYLKQRLEEISQGIAATFRAGAIVEFGSGCPTLNNDQGLYTSIYGYMQELLGPQKALSALVLGGGKPARGGGSEDFAYISQQIPSLMLAMAAGEPSKGYAFPLHHPKVKIDESILSTGAAVFAYSAIRYLQD